MSNLSEAIDHLEIAQQIIVVQAQINKSKTKKLMDVGYRLTMCKDDLRELAGQE